MKSRQNAESHQMGVSSMDNLNSLAYESPRIEVIEVQVEQGFAQSDMDYEDWD